jgi:hypothetical protein
LDTNFGITAANQRQAEQLNGLGSQ